MARLSTRITARLLVPLALLVVVVLDEMITYEVRQHVADPFLRTAAVVACYGVAFGIIDNRRRVDRHKIGLRPPEGG